jgi:hypothetical protein
MGGRGEIRERAGQRSELRELIVANALHLAVERNGARGCPGHVL